MNIKVYLTAFGRDGETREVDVPDEELKHTVDDLDRVFYWGQNDFQPQQHPSVSMGDVIEHINEKYLVCAVGFHKLTEQEWEDINKMPRLERSTWTYTKQQNVY